MGIFGQHRGRTYGPEVDDALHVISESMDYICAERLKPNLTWLAEHLGAHDELDASHLSWPRMHIRSKTHRSG